MERPSKRVVVLGASKKPERYSHKAVVMLKEYGHEVVPVHPVEEEIEGVPVAHDLGEIRAEVDTLSVYVGPQHLAPMIPSILALKPKRVILNPGAESAELEAALKDSGIPYLEACTLVMLRTNQF